MDLMLPKNISYSEDQEDKHSTSSDYTKSIRYYITTITTRMHENYLHCKSDVTNSLLHRPTLIKSSLTTKSIFHLQSLTVRKLPTMLLKYPSSMFRLGEARVVTHLWLFTAAAHTNLLAADSSSLSHEL